MLEGRRSCGSAPSAAVGDCGHACHLPGLQCFARAETAAMLVSSDNIVRVRGGLLIFSRAVVGAEICPLRNWITETIFEKIQHC